MSYQQLTEGKRYQIAALIAQGLRPSEIARIINVHRSMVPDFAHFNHLPPSEALIPLSSFEKPFVVPS